MGASIQSFCIEHLHLFCYSSIFFFYFVFVSFLGEYRTYSFIHSLTLAMPTARKTKVPHQHLPNWLCKNRRQGNKTKQRRRRHFVNGDAFMWSRVDLFFFLLSFTLRVKLGVLSHFAPGEWDKWKEERTGKKSFTQVQATFAELKWRQEWKGKH